MHVFAHDLLLMRGDGLCGRLHLRIEEVDALQRAQDVAAVAGHAEAQLGEPVGLSLDDSLCGQAVLAVGAGAALASEYRRGLVERSI